MHPIQQKLLQLLKDQGSIPLKYRAIGRRIGEKYPQTIKHHIAALLEKALLVEQNGFLKMNRTDAHQDFLNLPFYGLASCGSATAFAEDTAEGYIRISSNVLPRKDTSGLYLLRAFGNSMDRAKIGLHDRNIDNGDFVVVDATERDPKNGDYVVSVIDDCANIKKFQFDPISRQVALIAESSDEYFPIILHESDRFSVLGKVVDVIKSV